jgi:tetratricopeptide (TPR) repeat protein
VRRRLQLVLALLAAAAAAQADVFTWVDAEGVTHIADDPAAVPPDARLGRDGLGDLWGEGPQGRMPAATGPRAARVSLETSRSRRIVAGAVVDIERGETARAATALESALRIDPRLPDPHWYLAALDRERGRYASAEGHLRAFLGLAGEAYEPWRRAAEERLRTLVDEQRLADPASAGDADAWVGVAHPHFRIQYHSDLGRAEPTYAHTVVRYLEEARQVVGERLGTFPAEPMGVVLYGKAAYLRAHRHRFSFQTVGFYDGRIHVVSAAHPDRELRALLFHEYTHAVFREQTGGDRPYWLNEGLAELCERASRGHAGLTRSERSSLSQRIDAGTWIPLRRIAPSFSGLGDQDARSAYLVAAAAASWIETHSRPADRARMLRLLGEGRSDDDALADVLGRPTEGVDDAVRHWVRSAFPAPGNAALGPPP